MPASSHPCRADGGAGESRAPRAERHRLRGASTAPPRFARGCPGGGRRGGKRRDGILANSVIRPGFSLAGAIAPSSAAVTFAGEGYHFAACSLAGSGGDALHHLQLIQTNRSLRMPMRVAVPPHGWRIGPASNARSGTSQCTKTRTSRRSARTALPPPHHLRLPPPTPAREHRVPRQPPRPRAHLLLLPPRQLLPRVEGA